MIKPNSRSKFNKQTEISINFTFAIPKSKNNDKIGLDLTSAEKRALGMWLETVLEYHTDDFLRALKSSRKFSVIGISNYLGKYYSHLKTIVQYYIIAAMIDYELIISDKQEETSLEKQDLFINVVIEELVSRFFRQSQWLHKIAYMPIYNIFPHFDNYSKGYTTLNQLRYRLKRLLSTNVMNKANMVQNQHKTAKKKEKLLRLKLNNNIQGKDGKIYQQNVEQLMLRVNLINFEEKTGVASKRYQTIQYILEEYQQLITERYEKQCQQMVMQELREKEELQIMKQNYQIKYRSNAMSKSKNQNENKNQMNKAEDNYKIPESIFFTMPHHSSNLTTHKQNSDFSFKNKNRYVIENSKLDYQTAVRTQVQAEQLAVLQRAEEEMKQNIILKENQLHHQFVQQNGKQIEKNKKALQYRNTILQQLQFIREEKKSNRFRLFSYI